MGTHVESTVKQRGIKFITRVDRVREEQKRGEQNAGRKKKEKKRKFLNDG